MLSLAFSVLIAYLASRHVRRFIIPVVVGCTAVASVIANLMFLAYGTITSEELAGRVIAGTFFGTLIALIALFFVKGASSQSTAPATERSDTSVSELDAFIAALAANPSEDAIRERAEVLFDAGYDVESLIDLVWERGGLDKAALVQQALIG